MDTSVRPPRVPTRSFPLMTVPYTAGAPCSYWTLTCLAVSSALHSLMGFLFVSPVVCSRLPSDSTSRWTPLPFSYPFPTAGQGRDFHPIERAPAGRTKIRAAGLPAARNRSSGKFSIRAAAICICEASSPSSYSLCSAWIGSRLAAFTEGRRPNTMPISMEKPTPIRIAGTLMATGVPDICEIT